MNENEMIFYLQDLLFQAENVHIAFEELVKYSKQINTLYLKRKSILEKHSMSRCTSLLWIMIQSFLFSVANVSKMLWSLKNPNRSQELREALNVSEKHILEKTRFRNHFEHFDERIDTWAKKSGQKSVVDRLIDDKNKFIGIDPEDFFRHYDPRTMELTFYQEPYNPEAIVKEVRVIQEKTSAKFFSLIQNKKK